jgi:hypothetical protein
MHSPRQQSLYQSHSPRQQYYPQSPRQQPQSLVQSPVIHVKTLSEIQIKNPDKIDDTGIIELAKRIKSRYSCHYSEQIPNFYLFIPDTRYNTFRPSLEDKHEFKRMLLEYYNPLRIYVKGPHEMVNTTNWCIKLEPMPKRTWS